MNEDLSAMVRMGVQYTLLSCAMVFILVMVIIMSQRFSEFQSQSSNAIGYMTQGTLQQANGKELSAPAAHRILEETEGAVTTLEIKIGNHTYYDYTVLMKSDNITKTFYFEGVPDASGEWSVKLTER